MAELIPALRSLRDEFNRLAPGRDKRTDGAIGDPAHRARSSDHNPDDTPGSRTPSTDSDNDPEIHAIDVDMSGPWPLPFDLLVNIIVDRHRRGLDDRLQNVIWNGRIASRTWGWTWRTYTGGSNPHTEHAHFGGRYTTRAERDTRPWGLQERLDGDLPMDQAEFNKLMDGWAGSAGGKKHLRDSAEAAARADVVQRIDATGKDVPASDGNPTMGVNSALYYLARDVHALKGKVEQLGATTNEPAPSEAKTASGKAAVPAGAAKSAGTASTK